MRATPAVRYALSVILGSLFAVSCSFASLPMSDDEAAALIDSIGASNPIAAADKLSAGWRNSDALRVLETRADTTQPDVLWRLARSRIDIGENMVNQDDAEPLYRLAIAEAKRILETDPNHAEAHLRIATASGRVALLKGPFSAAGLVKDAFRHAHFAAANADSIPAAYFIIGRTHKVLMEKSGIARRLAGLSFASDDSIAFYFERALSIAKGGMIQARVEYGEYLLHEKEQINEARAQLEAALALPLRDEHDQESQQLARQLLTEM